MRAAVLCPGPSLHGWVESGRLPSVFTVALTDALLAPTPMDAWCFAEEPRGRLAYRYRRFHPHLPKVKEIWGANGHLEYWRAWDLDGIQLRCGPRPDDLLPWGKRIEHARDIRYQGSIFQALAGLIARGYDEIELFGCDMQGGGNYDPRTGELISDTTPEPSRWENERSAVERFTKEAGEHGVIVRRAVLSDLRVSQPVTLGPSL